MYRNSSLVNYLAKPSLPSPEHTSDSESEIIDTLDQKRRELDDEISKFKAIKDREFRDFERDLRSKRTRTRVANNNTKHSSGLSPTKPPTTTSTNNSVLNLLASVQSSSINGRVGQNPRKSTQSPGEKILKPAPLSKPTLSLDKLTIAGETTPLTSTFGSPPTTPLSLVRSSSRSSSTPATLSTTLSPVTTTPIKDDNDTSISEKGAPPPLPTPTTDRFDSFAGVFTPAFLPLLESRDHTPTTQRSPQPLTTWQQEEEKKHLQLDLHQQQQKQHHHQIQLNEKSKRAAIETPPSQSLPQQSVSPTVVATKRTHSTPQLPSTSLTSALRTTSGPSARKRKHVLFQLPDSAIVQPSSSYEEGPSPDLRAEIDGSLGADGPLKVGNGNSNSHASGHHTNGNSNGNAGSFKVLTRRKSDHSAKGHSDSNNTTPTKSHTNTTTKSLTPNSPTIKNRRLRSPAVSPLPSPAPSPIIAGILETSPSSTQQTGFSGGLAASDDGGSGVGFFELDEELASPAFAEDRTFDQLLDDEKDIDSMVTGQDVNENEKGNFEDDNHSDEKHINEDLGLKVNGNGQDSFKVGSFTAGSVPINIVRPVSGSWVGSYGH